MRLIGRTATALLTTAIVLGGTATAATAQSTTIKDKTSDVVTYADDNDMNGTALGYADSVASGADVRSIRVSHSKKSVTVTMKFARLKSDTTLSLAFRPSGKSRPNRVFTTTGRKSGVVYDLKNEARCTAPVSTKLGKGGSVRVTIKRSCLGTPKRLKVSAAAVRFDATTGAVTYDVVSKSSVRSPSYTKWLKAS
jgi:hypothetical protein